MPPPLLTDYLLPELCAVFEERRIKPFRAKQLWHWLYRQHVLDLSAAANLPAEVITFVKKHFTYPALQLTERLVSVEDLTEKYLFTLADGAQVETVLIKAPDRMTLCLSTQVGCAMGCVFCASTQSGFKRNLSAGEIVEQVLCVAHHLGPRHSIHNIVYMGIGEPLMNYDNVMKSIRILNDPQGLSIGVRHIMISTCGIIPHIQKLSREKEKVRLSVSIHSARTETRSMMMPINKKYDLFKLVAEIKKYAADATRQVAIEYLLIRDINDSLEDARALARLFKDTPCSFNLIGYNPVPGCAFGPSSVERMEVFKKVLAESGFRTTLRRKKGVDINAACGQLRINSRSANL
jgi:23S rRNA (adenine2503-C2)-methyltransferase